MVGTRDRPDADNRLFLKMRRAHTNPKLSVIIVCLNNQAVLDRCLAALAAQAGSCDFEILAVGRWEGEQDDLGLRIRYPDVLWVPVSDEYTVPLMRTYGITQSHGEIIALLEDDCVAAGKWCHEIINAHRAAYVAIGGPVEPKNYHKSLDWGIYFCEYGRFLQPFSGTVSALPGNNVSYKRTVLSDIREESGFYEVFFNWQLQQSGYALFADPKLVVYNVNSWSLSQVTAAPFHHGRAFAGMRAVGFPQWRRWLYASLTVGLPLIKLIRITREVIGRRRYLKQYFLCLHWVFLFMLSWSLGEFWGELFGAGDSAGRWR